ncbi:MAG: RNA ligase family protein [Gammaproteobacteria bacterium]|nr:RNA ligase family protein [Gammaproteobacteria bacterium]
MSESERNELLQHELIIEEKVDGANLGISFDSDGNIRAQNRGDYLHLSASGQWNNLASWLAPRTEAFFDVISDRYILFGEWCYAQHSVKYDRLPDWFLGFDFYDKQTDKFLAVSRRDELFLEIQVEHVPFIARGHFTLSEIKSLLDKSNLGAQPAEGICIRYESDNWLVKRAKLVRPSFLQEMDQHWSRSGIKKNRLESDAYAQYADM